MRQLTLNQARVLNRIKKQVKKGEIVSVSKAMRGIYSDATAKHPEKINTLPEFRDLIEKELPDSLLLKVHAEGLAATDGTGSPDYSVRHKYLDTGYKIKGKMPKENSRLGIQFNFGTDRDNYRT